MFSNSTPESFGPQTPKNAESKALDAQFLGTPQCKADSLGSHKRSETRVDHCGQSWFEVWLPIDALEAFDAWFDESLAEFEQQHADWMTPNSSRRRG